MTEIVESMVAHKNTQHCTKDKLAYSYVAIL